MSERSDSQANGPLSALLTRLAMPTDDWALRHGERRVSPLMVLMGMALLLLLLATGLAVLLVTRGAAPSGVPLALPVILGLCVLIVLILMFQVRRHLLAPMTHLYRWALRMCDGDLTARIPTPQQGRFAKLTFHINRLGEALERLANQMDELVAGQTERLKKKNQSLEILYEVAAAVNTADALDDMLERSTHQLMSAFEARAAAVRLRGEDGKLQLVKRIGAGREAADRARAPELDPRLDGRAVCAPREVGRWAAHADTPGLISVPLRYRDQSLGVIGLYTDQPEGADDGETRKLLSSVGKHLGMAIAKARLDEQSRKLSIVNERTELAHELHDSLAQTLAGLRFQVKAFDASGDADLSPAARIEVLRIENSLDEANTELRELIANFRAPIDGRGLLPALQDLVARFRRHGGISVYLQTECRELALPAAVELQVLRIVREALSNARKHSKAKMVRVFLRNMPGDNFQVLIEDDGVGFGDRVLRGRAGEHIGIEIMRERAKRIGAELRIESEPGEGTRIVLSFGLPARPAQLDEVRRRVS